MSSTLTRNPVMSATILHGEPEAAPRRLPTSLTTTISAPKHTQERLSWLLNQYNESVSKYPSISYSRSPNGMSSEALAERVFELLSYRNLLDGPLSKLAKPVRTLYPEMPCDVLTAWWEKRGLAPGPTLSDASTTLPMSVEKENVPPITSSAHCIPITTPEPSPSFEAALSSTPPCPLEGCIQSVSRPKNPFSSPEEEHSISSQKLPFHDSSAQSAKETSTSSRPTLSSITNIPSDNARLLLPGADTPASSAPKHTLQPSTVLLAIPLQSKKRHKSSSFAEPGHSSSTTEIVPGAAAKVPLLSDELQSDALHRDTDLDEASHDRQWVATTGKMSKDIGDPVAAKRRFLYERMNIFDIRNEWEPTPPQTRIVQREEGEGRMEYLARLNLL
ncbi:hypothetical protein CPB85DRAFT_1438158 [Mucidula mucida]|nr:hypothetical protein CPB85DRAFT_1496641 [Mucidula mucida]KAF8903824.1 hypothetical protein CPB85DRAFT_1438158 [Mucidula mucida]